MNPTELRAHLRAPFSDAEVEAMWLGAAARRSRSALRGWLSLAVPAAAAAALMIAAARPGPTTPGAARSSRSLTLASGEELPPRPLRAPDAAPLSLRFADRSRVQLSPGSELTPTRNDARAVEFRLHHGAAAFEVTPGGPRRWQVACDLAVITVVGTAFTVEQRPEALTVRVSHGTVWVDGAAVPSSHQALRAGQSLTVRRPTSTTAAEATAPPPPTPVRRAPRTSPAPHPWRRHAHAGDAESAWNALGDNGFVREAATASPSTLLELADVARRSRHHHLAAPLLERFVREHPTHPEAAMAAFTLGRDELSLRRRAPAAARWFERALTLRPPRALEEDVRARLVEALGAAGDASAACAAARSYLAAFPAGRHAARLERACAQP